MATAAECGEECPKVEVRNSINCNATSLTMACSPYSHYSSPTPRTASLRIRTPFQPQAHTGTRRPCLITAMRLAQGAGTFAPHRCLPWLTAAIRSWRLCRGLRRQCKSDPREHRPSRLTNTRHSETISPPCQTQTSAAIFQSSRRQQPAPCGPAQRVSIYPPHRRPLEPRRCSTSWNAHTAPRQSLYLREFLPARRLPYSPSYFSRLTRSLSCEL